MTDSDGFLQNIDLVYRTARESADDGQTHLVAQAPHDGKVRLYDPESGEYTDTDVAEGDWVQRVGQNIVAVVSGDEFSDQYQVGEPGENPSPGALDQPRSDGSESDEQPAKRSSRRR